jgi:hypothetical protein
MPTEENTSAARQVRPSETTITLVDTNGKTVQRARTVKGVSAFLDANVDAAQDVVVGPINVTVAATKLRELLRDGNNKEVVLVAGALVIENSETPEPIAGVRKIRFKR